MQAKQTRIPTVDRRSGKDRRAAPRFSVRVDAEWDFEDGRKKGIVSDISLHGCFVLCSGEVDDGKPVRLILKLGDEMNVEFSGEVANHVYDIGFGMFFTALGSAQKNFLHKFIETIG